MGKPTDEQIHEITMFVLGRIDYNRELSNESIDNAVNKALEAYRRIHNKIVSALNTTPQ